MDPHISLGVACVYKLTFNSNRARRRRSYIGKTVQPLQRYIKYDLIRRDSYIGRALRKHDRATFKVEIILVGTEEYCFEMERLLIEREGTKWPGGYNINGGGRGMTSEDARRVNKLPQIIEANRRKNNSAKGREHMKRIQQLPQTRVAIARWNKSPEGRAHIRGLKREQNRQ